MGSAAVRFVPVACVACGRPFQAPAELVGQTTQCPWCQASTAALPIAPAAVASGVSGVTTPSETPAEATAPSGSLTSLASEGGEGPSVSLLPPGKKSQAPAECAAVPPPPTLPVAATSATEATFPQHPSQDVKNELAAPPWSRRQVTAALVLLFVITTGTLGLLRYHRGYGLATEWRSFSSADGSVQALLLGSPREETDPDGGIRYWSQGWYSGVVAFVGWQPLTEQQAELARLPDARQKLDRLIQAELDRWRQRFGGDGRTATLQFADPLVVEIKWSSDDRLGLGRIVVVPRGREPRAYFLGLIGRQITPERGEVRRFFEAFHYEVLP